ncbi:MAG: hypothetical protein ACLTQI_07195 [Slackia sp.]
MEFVNSAWALAPQSSPSSWRLNKEVYVSLFVGIVMAHCSSQDSIP